MMPRERVGYSEPDSFFREATHSMQPVPKFDPPLVFNDPPLKPAVRRPTPRWLPIVLWYLWIVATSLVVIYIYEEELHYSYNYQLTEGLLIANLLLTPAWAALAIRPVWSQLFPVLLAYLFACYISYFRDEYQQLGLIMGVIAGTWCLLRWARIVTLDLLSSETVSSSRTPRLSDHIQFSLRSLILLFVVVAFGISLHLFFHESQGWDFYQIMFLVVLPSELLIFWGILGRSKWLTRLPWIFVAIHHWILLEVVNHGFRTWEQLYELDSIRWLNIPISQIVSLGLLRWAGYRIGIPRPREQVLPLTEAVEPQSPWD